jgi:Leucine-rich repeat (LRR) protein
LTFPHQISPLTRQFPSLTSLTASTNHISLISSPLSATIRNLTLEHNEITSLSSIRLLASLPNLERLSLRGNNISSVVSSESTTCELFQFSHSLKYLDVSYNRIDSWLFVNALPNIFPGLSSLRISDNPLYDQPVAPSNVTNLPEKPMTVDEAFMLTLARLGTLTTLNYSKISQQDRTNGELYYLSLIGKELSALPKDEEKNILSKHPRFAELCEIYGEPTIKRSTDTSQGVAINPRSVAARLVNFKFYLWLSSPSIAEGKREQTYEIPRTFDIYKIKAIVSRLFALPPLRFKMIWETDEWDPVEEVNIGGEEWDSGSDDDDGDDDNQVESTIAGQDVSDRPGSDEMQASVITKEDGSKFIKREVELADSARQVGFWFDDNLREARVRIEAL